MNYLLIGILPALVLVIGEIINNSGRSTLSPGLSYMLPLLLPAIVITIIRLTSVVGPKAKDSFYLVLPTILTYFIYITYELFYNLFIKTKLLENDGEIKFFGYFSQFYITITIYSGLLFLLAYGLGYIRNVIYKKMTKQL